MIRFRAKKEAGERSSRLGDSVHFPLRRLIVAIALPGADTRSMKAEESARIYRGASSGASRVYINRKNRVNVPDV